MVAPASRRHLGLDNSFRVNKAVCRLEAGATFFLTSTARTEFHRGNGVLRASPCTPCLRG